MELSRTMEDVQNRADDREISIDQAGVSDLRYPIVVWDRQHERQQTVARVTMSVNLPHHFKGTHMSRFVEVLNEYRGEITLRTLPRILRELKGRLDAESAQIELVFPYFLERTAPVSGAVGLMDYECSFAAEANVGTEDFVLGVKVPVTSLCPCSKAISDYGAHNQRGHIHLQVRSTATGTGEPAIIWIEELVEVAERSASAPVYPVLKRPDERHVTMQAYDNPAFVEDMVRSVATQLKADSRVKWFRVHAMNHESIHNHSAFAATSWQRPEAEQRS
jgi:GTP cyclohydrolase I